MSTQEKQTLFDIAHDLRALMDAIIEAGGEITDEQNERHDALQDAATQKRGAYIFVLNELKEEAKALKKLEKHYKAKRKAKENAIQRMKDTLLWSMEATGDEVAETDAGTIRVQEHWKRGLEVTGDPDDLPNWLTKIKRMPDKTAIREHIEETGDEELTLEYTDGKKETVARLKEPSRYVRIY